MRAAAGELNSLLIEDIQGNRLINSFALKDQEKKRFKEHKEMLDGLKKGDKVVTAGGLLGTIETIDDASDEVVLDMGHGTKVSALRSTIHQKHDKKSGTAKKEDNKADKKKDDKK